MGSLCTVGEKGFDGVRTLARRRGGAICGHVPAPSAFEPFRFEALPAAGNHRVGGFVWVRAFGKLAGKQLGGIRGQRLAETLAMGNDGLSAIRIENGFEHRARG